MIQSALEKFTERYAHALKEVSKELSSWPTLDTACELGLFTPLDLAFARHYAPPSEATAAFLAYLLVASRQGHLCVKVCDNTLSPDPSAVWAAAPDMLPILCQLIVTGAVTLSSSLLSRPELLVIDPLPRTPVCAYGSHYYLQKNWVYEARFAYHLRRLQAGKAPLKPPADLPIGLQPEQALAIQHAFAHGVTFVSGGPGTGKTYTAGHLAHLFLLRQDKPCHVALLAPTGKAAIRLHVSLTRQIAPSTFPQATITASTLHKALGISPYRNTPKHDLLHPLQADLLIVDEASMIDVRLMADLLAAVKEGARVVFLGDKDQLPPVEAGALFAEITRTEAPWVVSLQACLRTDIVDLATMATYIKTGQVEEALSLLEAGSPSISRHSLQGQTLTEHLGNRLPLIFRQGWDKKVLPEQILKELDDFCLLTPLRQGPMGVNNLNKMLESYCNSHTRPRHWPCRPIIVTRNAPTLDLYNGEVGLMITPDDETPPFAWFKGADGVATRHLPVSQLPDYEAAYCLSVHKSQGSEFRQVFLLVPPGSEVFGKEVLYTAITRARAGIEILGETETIRQLLSQETKRLSACASRLSL